MTPLYEDTQFSRFVMIYVPVMLAFLVTVDLLDTAEPVPLWIYPVVMVVPLLFVAMRVKVTREYVQVAMYLGFPRRRIRIADIKSCETFEHAGFGAMFGTRIKPLQGHYQMSGGRGLVIVPTNGQPLTVSAHEPAKMKKAIERAMARTG